MIRNGLYNVGGQAIRGAVAILTIPFLIRFLGIREYGVWSLAYAVLGLMTLSETGISVAAAVFLSKDLSEDNSRTVNETLTVILSGALLMAILFGILLWLGGSIIAQSVLAFRPAERAEAGWALRIAGLAVFVYIIQRTLIGIEQAFDRYGVINALDVSQSLMGNVGLVVVAWLGGTTVAMMKWQVFVWTVLLTLHCIFVFRVLRGRRLSLRWGASKTREIFQFSVAAWASSLGSAAFGQCDRLIIGSVLGAPLLGVYSAITNITSKINSFSGTAVQPLVPTLSRSLATISTSVKGHVRQAVRLNALIAVESCIFLFVLADWIIQLMIPGAGTPQSILGLQIAAIIYAVYSVAAPGYFILFSLGAAKENAIVVLSSSAFSLTLIFLGARYFGLLGALAGNIGYIGVLLLTALGMRKVGVSSSRYLSWMALPCLWLPIALVIGLVLKEHLQWRVAFCLAQAVMSGIWFFHHHPSGSQIDSKLWRVFGS